jgi:hypothetical protein
MTQKNWHKLVLSVAALQLPAAILISATSAGYCAGQEVESYIFLDEQGTAVSSPLRDAKQFHDGIASVRQGNGWQGLNKQGIMLHGIESEEPFDFSEKLALVRIHAKVGFMNEQGNLVIPAQFDDAQAFKDGLAAVKIQKRWGCIDHSGNFVIKPKFEVLGQFSQGLAPAKLESGKFGYIDKSGNFQIPEKFSYASTFDGQFAFVATLNNDEISLINRKAQIICNVGPFNAISKIDHGLVRFVKGQKVGYLRINNDKSQVDIEPKFDFDEQTSDRTGWFSDGMAAVKIGAKFGYIDSTGTIKIEPKFDFAGPFCDGLATVRLNQKYGYIDKSGKVIIPAKYEWADSFAEHRALVKVKSMPDGVTRPAP